MPCASIRWPSVPFRSSDDDQLRRDHRRLTVTVWVDPFRIDVHRADGTAVIETAQDRQGHYWAYATLNDSFTVRRRCRREDAIFGLGEKSGRHNRKGRDFTMWNTDVLSPYETRSSPADLGSGRPARRPDRRWSSTRSTSASRSSTTRTTPPVAMAGSFRGQRISRRVRVLRRRGVPDPLRGGQYTEYIFAGPDMPADPRTPTPG